MFLLRRQEETAEISDCSLGDAEQIVLVAVFDQDLHKVAWLQARGVAEVDFAVDFRRIGLGAAGGADVVMMFGMRSVEVPTIRAFISLRLIVDAVDQHVDRLADLGGELLGGDARGQLHDALVALFLHLFGDTFNPPLFGAVSDTYGRLNAYTWFSFSLIPAGVCCLIASRYAGRDMDRLQVRLTATPPPPGHV